MVTRIQKTYGAHLPEKRGRVFDSYKMKRKASGAFQKILVEVWREQEGLKYKVLENR